MNLYEIKTEYEKAFEAAVDPETGEIIDIELLSQLEGQLMDKIDAVCSFIKSQEAEAEAIKAEVDKLTKRMNQRKKKAEGLKKYLGICLNGEKFSNGRHSVSYITSQKVEVDMDSFIKNPNYEYFLNYAEPKPDKKAIKKAIEGGTVFEGAQIIVNSNLQLN